MEYRHLLKNPKHRVRWQSSFGREIRRLATDTETIGFIRKSEIPIDRRKDETYARIVVDERPEKADPDQTRITMGGDKINYPGDCGTPTADLLTVKILFNSIVSTPGAKFMTLDIKDFYLMTPMDRYEYFRMKLDLFKRYHRGIWTKGQSRQQGICTLRSATGNVWITTSWIISTTAVDKETQQGRLHPKQIVTRILEA